MASIHPFQPFGKPVCECNSLYSLSLILAIIRIAPIQTASEMNMSQTPPNPYQATPQYQPPQGQYPSSETDATGGVIPYKNPHALIAYYLGLFSLFPCLGLLLAIPAFILGIMGLKRVKANPAIRGTVHAWIGVVMGGLMTVVWSAAIVIALLAAAFSQ